ncbi:MAG: hypothetical protein OEV49_11270 [candidate division Zixibacteria bacterium]|nr:hypothetical protein [candidate division Zixibacteria bacterium]MDH3937511.1 hypothetical protein [candidate division Zixibacteria bacterium]
MTKAIVICVLLSAMSAGPATAEEMCAISVDHVDGLVNGMLPILEQGITYQIRLTNYHAEWVAAATNGFEISGSNPSVTWEVHGWGVYWNPPDEYFNLFFEMPGFSVDGQGADTIGFGGSKMNTGGLPPGYDSISYWIEVAITDPMADGHLLCLDSCFYPPNATWRWSYGFPDYNVPPIWDGPHCFEIVSCCQDLPGNVDFDPEDHWNISDLIYLVEFMFEGGLAPPCPAEADFYPDGTIDISDLVAMIDYMFTDQYPAACP